MNSPEKFQPEQSENTPSGEELREEPAPKGEVGVMEPITDFLRGLSVFQKEYPDDPYYKLLNQNGSFTEKGREFASMMFEHWSKGNVSPDELRETFADMREKGGEFLEAENQQKEKTILFAVLDSANDRLRKKGAEKSEGEGEYESRFLELTTEIVPWRRASEHLQEKWNLTSLSGSKELKEEIVKALTIQEIEQPTIEKEAALLDQVLSKLPKANPDTARLALEMTINRTLPEREIQETSTTGEEIIDDLYGEIGSDKFNEIIQKAVATTENLVMLEANPGVVTEYMVEEVLKEIDSEKTLGRQLLDKLTRFKLSPKAKAAIVAGVIIAGVAISLAAPFATEVAAAGPSIVEEEPKTMPDPTKIVFEKPESPIPYWEKFQPRQITEGLPESLDITHGYTEEQLEAMWDIPQPASAICMINAHAWGISLMSRERDANPAELASMMKKPGMVIKEIRDLNRIPLDPELVKQFYGVEVKEEVLPRNSVESIVDFFIDKFEHGDTVAVYPMAVGNYAHTLLALGAGSEDDGTPFLIFGDAHRGKYVGNEDKSKNWPYFEELGFEKVGDFLKLRLIPEKLDEIQKYLPDIATVFSEVEG